MIKAIIFDLGGVVLNHSFENSAELMSINFAVRMKTVKKLYEEVKEDWSLGKITINDVAKKFKYLLPKPISSKDIINSWKKEHIVRVTINQDVVKIIDLLRKNYQVILLSNTIDLHFNAIAETKVYTHFDKILASYKLGFRKPDKKIFELTLSQINFKPKETVFIDDNIENVKGARSAGLNTIYFIDAADLAEKLTSFGVKLQ